MVKDRIVETSEGIKDEFEVEVYDKFLKGTKVNTNAIGLTITGSK